MWRTKPEVTSDRAVPPWAAPDAQAPPPPSQLHHTLSPPPQRRQQMKPAAPTASAVEATPSPTHFNRPAPGSSPVAARRSLFRNNAPHRARSVDSIPRNPPWTEHKLRHTPRTESPLTKATSSTALEKSEEYIIPISMEPRAAAELNGGCPVPGVDALQQPPSEVVSASPAADGQPGLGSLPQEQSSPTPWRKNVAGRADGANVTNAQQQQQPAPGQPTPSPVADSARSAAGGPAAPATQQAPWRRPTVEAEPLSQTSTGKATPTTQQPAQQETARADSQPSWRKQRTKPRQAETSGTPTVPAASSQPSPAPSASGTTSQSVSLSAAATTAAAAVTTVSQTSSAASATTVTGALTQVTGKSASQVPGTAEKPVSAGPVATSTGSPQPPPTQPTHAGTVDAQQSAVSPSSSSSSRITPKGQQSSPHSAGIAPSPVAATQPKGAAPGTKSPATPPEPPQRGDSSSASIRSRREFPHSPTPPAPSPTTAASRPSAADHPGEAQHAAPAPLPPREATGAAPQPTPSQGGGRVSPPPTMPIPTPPSEPSANLLKAGGLTPSPQTALEDTSSGKTPLQTDAPQDTLQEMTSPVPPPPPPPTGGIIPPGRLETTPFPPPPPSLVPEGGMAGPSLPMSQLQGGDESKSEDYVRESVTKRIKAFEKQASKEEDEIAERLLPPARPVAPWVKKTSTGAVQHDTYWDMTSPEEPSGVAPMPAPAPPQVQAQVPASTPAPAPAPAPAPPPPPQPAHAHTNVKQVERTMSPSRPALSKVPVWTHALSRPPDASP